MIFELWQGHLEVFLNLPGSRDFPSQEIGRYKAMIERLMAQGPDGTWQSYDDASNYYSEGTDLAKGSCYSYISIIINKLRGYHLNWELPVHRICKGHFSESDHNKGKLDFLPSYERLDTFISCYHDEDYSASFITSVRRIVQRVIVLSRTIEWNSFQEIKDWYRNQGLSEKYLYAVFSVLNKFEYWRDHGVFPLYAGIQPQLRFVEPSIGTLDLTNLQTHLNTLLSYMEEHVSASDKMKENAEEKM